MKNLCDSCNLHVATCGASDQVFGEIEANEFNDNVIECEFHQTQLPLKYSDEVLQQKTEKWGHDRKITINGNIPTQTIKFGEEMGELFEAVTPNGAKDAIGDMIVVLSMIANLNKSSIDTCQSLHNEECVTIQLEGRAPVHLLAANYGKLCSAVVRDKHHKVDFIINSFMIILKMICKDNGFTINECWTLAYTEIKDRTGTLLENGNFVKDEE